MEVIRQAIVEDAPALADLDKVSDDWPWKTPAIASACAGTGGQASLLIEPEDTLNAPPLAYIAFGLVLDEGSILRIAVHPDHRKKGLGGRLIDAALLQLRGEGAGRILLELRRNNIAAQALYRSRGFIVDAQRKGYYPAAQGREDALLMSLTW